MSSVVASFPPGRPPDEFGSKLTLKIVNVIIFYNRLGSFHTGTIYAAVSDQNPEPAMTAKRKSGDGAERQVRHATFEQLSEAGYDVEFIEDGAVPLDLEVSLRQEIPENWKRPQRIAEPKVATLRGAELLHYGPALLPDGRFCYSDSSFGQANWRVSFPSRFRFADGETDNGTVNMSHERVVAVSGRCFSTLCNTSRNYGHFVHDVLTRIYYEDLGIIAPGREKVIAPEFAFPMQKAMFECVFANYEIVRSLPRTLFEVEELLLPANLCSWTRFNPKCVEALARRMRRIVAPYEAERRIKVCVSRGDGPSGPNIIRDRDFANADAFETRMRELGYQVVEASSLDPEGQFALWANASSIVGVHGAGMKNMIMMPAGSFYAEIAGNATGREYAAKRAILTTRCAAAAGHRVHGIESSHDDDYRQWIDIGRLEEMLRKAS